jgi:hypothetical protein
VARHGGDARNAAVLRRDLPDDGEPEPARAALVRRAGGGLRERLEQPLLLLQRDAGAVVGDGDPDADGRADDRCVQAAAVAVQRRKRRRASKPAAHRREAVHRHRQLTRDRRRCGRWKGRLERDEPSALSGQ